MEQHICSCSHKKDVVGKYDCLAYVRGNVAYALDALPQTHVEATTGTPWAQNLIYLCGQHHRMFCQGKALHLRYSIPDQLYTEINNVQEDTMNQPIIPTRICCGQKHLGDVCPDGTIMCGICFGKFTAEQWDNEIGCCKVCAISEKDFKFRLDNNLCTCIIGTNGEISSPHYTCTHHQDLYHQYIANGHKMPTTSKEDNTMNTQPCNDFNNTIFPITNGFDDRICHFCGWKEKEHTVPHCTCCGTAYEYFDQVCKCDAGMCPNCTTDLEWKKLYSKKFISSWMTLITGIYNNTSKEDNMDTNQTITTNAIVENNIPTSSLGGSSQKDDTFRFLCSKCTKEIGSNWYHANVGDLRTCLGAAPAPEKYTGRFAKVFNQDTKNYDYTSNDGSKIVFDASKDAIFALVKTLKAQGCTIIKVAKSKKGQQNWYVSYRES